MNKLFLGMILLILFSNFVLAEDNITVEDFSIISSEIKIYSECWIEPIVNISEINENYTNFYEVANCLNNLTIETQSNKDNKNYKKENTANITGETFSIDIIKKLTCEQSSITNLTEVCQETLKYINDECIIENEDGSNESKGCLSAYNIYRERTNTFKQKANEYDTCQGNISEYQSQLTTTQSEKSTCEGEKSGLNTQIENKQSQVYLWSGIMLVVGIIGTNLYIKRGRSKSEYEKRTGESYFEKNPFTKNIMDLIKGTPPKEQPKGE